MTQVRVNVRAQQPDAVASGQVGEEGSSMLAERDFLYGEGSFRAVAQLPERDAPIQAHEAQQGQAGLAVLQGAVSALAALQLVEVTERLKLVIRRIGPEVAGQAQRTHVLDDR